jgi:hypothetical protein
MTNTNLSRRLINIGKYSFADFKINLPDSFYYAIVAKNFVILSKILKTFIHGLSVAAGSRHSRAGRL